MSVKHQLLKALSTLDSGLLPKAILPKLNRNESDLELRARANAQSIAINCAEETIAELRPGWSERKTAAFLRDRLKARGVSAYFHRPLVWFGDHTLFAGVETFKELRPTDRILMENDVYILDFAPIIDGIGCDFSITGCMGEVADFKKAQMLLTEIYKEIPSLIVSSGFKGSVVWNHVHEKIKNAGYTGLTATSPYAFFGHRVNGTSKFPLASSLAQKGIQTYNEFFARGILGQLWSSHREADLTGVWAVEPHFCTPSFGIKFEELLVVSGSEAFWLREKSNFQII